MGVHALKVPKLATFDGTRNVILVENFFLGLQQYFEALGVIDDYSHINNSLTFLWDVVQL